MLLTILIVAIMLGLVMPVFWIVGTVGSITYVGLKGMGAARKERTEEQTFVLNPHLGFTMADGGEPVDEEKNESAAVNSMSEMSQDSPEQVAQKPVRSKMFWWGGY